MNGFHRFMGGSPAQVLLRLIVLSLVVGIVLSVLGLTPADIWYSLRELVLRIWHMGFGAIDSIWQYFVLGAVIVIPIWLIVRLLNLGRGS